MRDEQKGCLRQATYLFRRHHPLLSRTHYLAYIPTSTRSLPSNGTRVRLLRRHVGLLISDVARIRIRKSRRYLRLLVTAHYVRPAAVPRQETARSCKARGYPHQKGPGTCTALPVSKTRKKCHQFQRYQRHTSHRKSWEIAREHRHISLVNLKGSRRMISRQRRGYKLDHELRTGPRWERDQAWTAKERVSTRTEILVNR